MFDKISFLYLCTVVSISLLLFSNNENSTEHYTATEKLKVSFPEKSVEPESEEESQMQA